MHALSDAIGRLTVKTLDRKSARLGALLGSWEAIVGRNFAQVSLPVKLARGGTTDEDAPAILHLAVPAAWKTEFQHEAPQLIARINSFFGYKAVGELRFSARIPRHKPQTAAAPRQRSSLKSSDLDAKVAEIADPDLRAALLRLGEAIRTRSD